MPNTRSKRSPSRVAARISFTLVMTVIVLCAGCSDPKGQGDGIYRFTERPLYTDKYPNSFANLYYSPDNTILEIPTVNRELPETRNLIHLLSEWDPSSSRYQLVTVERSFKQLNDLLVHISNVELRGDTTIIEISFDDVDNTLLLAVDDKAGYMELTDIPIVRSLSSEYGSALRFAWWNVVSGN
jgi:hypothetical protein